VLIILSETNGANCTSLGWTWETSLYESSRSESLRALGVVCFSPNNKV